MTRAEISLRVASSTGEDVDVGFTDGPLTGAVCPSISDWISERLWILDAWRQTIRSGKPAHYRCKNFEDDN